MIRRCVNAWLNRSARVFSGVLFAAAAATMVLPASFAQAEDGYDLWLRYNKVANQERLAQYREALTGAAVIGSSPTCDAIRDELNRALPALLDKQVAVSSTVPASKALIAGTFEQLDKAGVRLPDVKSDALGDEGFVIRTQDVGGRRSIVIAGRRDAAVLYGVFHFLRLLQTEQDLARLEIQSVPRIQTRMLNHWDNVNRSIERGYAGKSLWNWSELPGKIDPRYRDYARACASVGINATVLNNVNANSKFLSREYLEKAAALADVLRPYGVRVYLSARFTCPQELGGLKTCDPRDPAVARWWKEKAEEIHGLIPDFGGFLVKANSEGQPGPQDYGATHADGANMMAAAVASFGGQVFWRAFVYDVKPGDDRARCAMDEFAPLDGKFAKNVFVQVKNGPLDFQPREPFSPLFGRMPKTPLAAELQITQEYLGHSTHLVFLAPMWKEFLDAKTHADGKDSPVAEVLDGSVDGHAMSAIAGVANTGTDRNWCGHHFAQANWYAYGRLAWDPRLAGETVADEWARMTWSNDASVVAGVKAMLLPSHEACVNYMSPLGLNVLSGRAHYVPSPKTRGYFHRGDAAGLGYDRTKATGSAATQQYHEPLASRLEGLDTCPESLLCWFHHVPWDHRMRSGRTFWEELQARYDAGAAACDRMLELWDTLKDKVDPERHAHVRARLEKQRKHAREWRKACVEYFRQLAEPDKSPSAPRE